MTGVRFHLLAYPEAHTSDLGIAVEQAVRRESSDKAELLLDIRIHRREPVTEPLTVPVRVVVNGIGSTLNVELKGGGEALVQAQAIPLDKNTRRGWGRVELSADGSPADNTFYFVFDESPVLKSVIVSDVGDVSLPLRAALIARTDPARAYECIVLPVARIAEIAWDETALVVWQAPLPEKDSTAAAQLEAHLDAGRSLLFLPPTAPDASQFGGARWTSWHEASPEQPVLADWWRNDTGLLQATRAGAALPVGEVQAQRWCGVEGEFIPLARLGDAAGKAPLLLQTSRQGGGGAYFLTTLPGPGASSLARDGVVLFAMLHRALNDGAAALGNARQRVVGTNALGADPSAWRPIDADDRNPATVLSIDRPLRAGVLKRAAQEAGKPELLVGLNRAPQEDAPQTMARTSLDELFAGLDWRLLERTLANEKSLTSEVWRTFLLLMGAALIFEALLCMPGRKAAVAQP